MSHDAHATMHPDALLRDIASKLPVKPNARKRMIWMVCMAIGVISFGWLLMTTPQRAWGAYTINTLYFLGIAQAGVVLACAIRLGNGRWAGPVMRIAESLSAYLPFGIGFMVILLAVGVWNYLPWVHHVEPHQAPYLNIGFLWARTLIGLGLLYWLSRDLVRISLRTDAYLLKTHVPPELKGEYDKLSQGWRGDEAEEKWQRDRLAMRAPQIVLVYAGVFTVLSWDFVMSLTPEWVSTLFGWWFFMGAFLTGIAMTAFLSTQFRAKYRLEDYITRDHFWDIGKILFGFCVFWAYQYWSQYLPIWYGNLPEETGWVFLRFEEPWRPYGFAAFGFIFAIPFVSLLNWYTKKNPFWLAFFSLMVLTGMWIERHVLVMPSLNPDTAWIGLPELGVTLGFLGVFGWAVQSFVTKYPVVKVADALRGEGRGH